MYKLLKRLVAVIDFVLSHIPNFGHFLRCWLASQQESTNGDVHNSTGLYRILGSEVSKGEICGTIRLAELPEVALKTDCHPYLAMSWIVEAPDRVPWGIYIASRENSAWYYNPDRYAYRSEDFIGINEISDLVRDHKAQIIVTGYANGKPQYALWVDRGDDAAWQTHLLQEEWEEQYVAKHAAKLLAKAERKLDRTRKAADKIEAINTRKQQRVNRKLRNLVGEIDKLQQYA